MKLSCKFNQRPPDPPWMRMVKINKRIKYKPGYRVNISVNKGFDFYSVIITYKADDSDNVMPCANAVTYVEQIGSKCEVDLLTDEQIVEKVRKCVVNAEIHEAHEWLRFDGKRIRDPHAEDRKVKL